MTYSKRTSLTLSRPHFLASSACMAVSGLVAAGSPWARALADDGGEGRAAHALRQQLRQIAASSNFKTVRQLFATLVQDPALPALASQTLQGGGADLTTFQASLLQSIAIMTQDPGALAARISGTPLTEAQRESLETIRSNLEENPAIQRLRRAGAQLKEQKNLALLQSDVGQVVTNATTGAPPAINSGNATLDAVMRDGVSIQTSTASAGLIQAVVPLMQSAAFVPLLREQRPEVLATFLPPATMIALELPQGVDPFLPPEIFTILQILGAIAGAILALVTLPADIAEVLTVLTFEAAITYLAQKLANLFGDSDGDNDGD